MFQISGAFAISHLVTEKQLLQAAFMPQQPPAGVQCTGVVKRWLNEKDRGMESKNLYWDPVKFHTG